MLTIVITFFPKRVGNDIHLFSNNGNTIQVEVYYVEVISVEGLIIQCKSIEKVECWSIRYVWDGPNRNYIEALCIKICLPKNILESLNKIGLTKDTQKPLMWWFAGENEGDDWIYVSIK